MTARCIMVLGTSSGAGKSWLTTALCRYYANQGLKVAPFKAQNMSNNARVVAGWPGAASSGGSATGEAVERGGDHPVAGPLPRPGEAPSGGSATGEAVERGGEIGSAQYFQALAARAEPDVRMNPLLLKPEADTRSQVVLLGRVQRELTDVPWRGRGERVWPEIAASLDALRAENDVVVIEGAGSPAEINLMASDIVNLRVARHADARCLLVADIDRGGAFAHLYGTWALLPEADRARIHGFVLNKFRGDATLLAPAPEQLQALTGVPTVATIPMHWQHGLPEEDGVFDDRATPGAPPAPQGALQGAPRHVAVVAYPRISNLDEFQPLKNLPGVRLVWARTPAELGGADTVVLPGSKATAADLAWLRAQGLDAAIAEHAARGGRVLGICGGLQMLGEALIDVHGVEPVCPGDHPGAGPLPRPGAAPSGGSGPRAAGERGGGHDTNGPGLGLLPLVTSFDSNKTVRHTHTRFEAVTGPWAALSGVAVSGYEIHSGQTAQHPAMAAKGDVAREVIPNLAWQNPAGNVLGMYLHGLFEDAAVLRALWGAEVRSLDDVFEGLAAGVQAHFAPGVLQALLE
ncbi:MAG: cobyric acid synthase [Proteobacteria bacterium]|nr:cobyric acid synthase [Pseudomonadota bacterium]